MKKLKVIFTIIFLHLSTCLFAQSTFKPDTVYYLVDTGKIPKNERMVEIGLEGAYRYYAIQCACLKYKQNPVFYYESKQKGTSVKKLKNIKFVSISQLIKLSQEGEGDLFNNKHIAIFIEPEAKGFIKHQVILQKPIKHEPTNTSD